MDFFDLDGDAAGLEFGVLLIFAWVFGMLSDGRFCASLAAFWRFRLATAALVIFDVSLDLELDDVFLEFGDPELI